MKEILKSQNSNLYNNMKNLADKFKQDTLSIKKLISISH